jgi:hypothetical protein
VIVACGPESSGTRLLTEIIRDYLGLEVTHRSMPHGEEWWDWTTFEDARFVVIVRRPISTARSAVAAGHVKNMVEHRREWATAISALSGISGAYWISYEALVANPVMQTNNLARWLGVTPVGVLPHIYDANKKWEHSN